MPIIDADQQILKNLWYEANHIAKKSFFFSLQMMNQNHSTSHTLMFCPPLRSGNMQLESGGSGCFFTGGTSKWKKTTHWRHHLFDWEKIGLCDDF